MQAGLRRNDGGGCRDDDKPIPTPPPPRHSSEGWNPGGECRDGEEVIDFAGWHVQLSYLCIVIPALRE